MIVEEIFKSLKGQLKTHVVKEIRIGVYYTGVLLDDTGLGLAYSFRDEPLECCMTFKRAGALEGPAWDLAALAMSSKSLEASVGVATINALVNREIIGEEGDILEFLELEGTEKIAIVGNIRPIARKLMQAGHEVLVFERRPQNLEVHPDWAAEYLLPTADIAIITAVTFINKTLDHLLDLAKNARTIAIVGPSTPLAVKILREHEVTYLGGMVVEDTEKALKIISQGGGAQELKTATRKVTVNLKKSAGQ
ncbi:MAG: Rossmann-like domain-containing protein [Candidatus Heimdallarchaeota archaeon]